MSENIYIVQSNDLIRDDMRVHFDQTTWDEYSLQDKIDRLRILKSWSSKDDVKIVYFCKSGGFEETIEAIAKSGIKKIDIRYSDCERFEVMKCCIMARLYGVECQAMENNYE